MISLNLYFLIFLLLFQKIMKTMFSDPDENIESEDKQKDSNKNIKLNNHNSTQINNTSSIESRMQQIFQNQILKNI